MWGKGKEKVSHCTNFLLLLYVLWESRRESGSDVCSFSYEHCITQDSARDYCVMGKACACKTHSSSSSKKGTLCSFHLPLPDSQLLF